MEIDYERGAEYTELHKALVKILTLTDYYSGTIGPKNDTKEEDMAELELAIEIVKHDANLGDTTYKDMNDVDLEASFIQIKNGTIHSQEELIVALALLEKAEILLERLKSEK